MVAREEKEVLEIVNGKYIRKDVYEQREKLVDERCERDMKAIEELKDAQEATDKKITATLVFAIITLITLLITIGLHAHL